jgi:hypothetical protein
MKQFLFFLSGYAFGFGIACFIAYIREQNKLIYMYKRGYMDSKIKSNQNK